MPNSETFTIKPIKELLSRHVNKEKTWIDPFVRNSIFKDFCKFTNDLNPEISATHNMEALDFLKIIESNSVDGVLFDPPYSFRQIQECYNGIGRKVFQSDTQGSFYKDKKDQIQRVLNKNGHEWQREEARTLLNVGDAYTVLSIDIGGFSSSVVLKEFPNISFNTVMFVNDENKMKTKEQLAEACSAKVNIALKMNKHELAENFANEQFGVDVNLHGRKFIDFYNIKVCLKTYGIIVICLFDGKTKV